LAIDVTVFTDQGNPSATLVSPAFSTNSGNELLLAFIGADAIASPNTTVTGVTGAGLSWTLVKRTNATSGDAEIWRAFAPSALSQVRVTATLSQSVASSITIVSFKGADTVIGATGSGSGVTAPAASLTTTRNGSWVIGVGNDFSAAVARTLDAGQVLVHQDLQSSSLATAPKITLAWGAPVGSTDPVAGYELWLGLTSGSEKPNANLGNVTTYTVSLQSGTTYFAVVTAYDSAGANSLPSNEVTFTAP